MSEVFLIEHGELRDDYALAAYSVGGLRLITLKRHINLQVNRSNVCKYLPPISHSTVNNKIMLGIPATT